MAMKFQGMKRGTVEETLSQMEYILRTDEQLLRLLNYLPEGYDSNGYRPPPLDESLPNLYDEDDEKYWNMVAKKIVNGDKTSDLENEAFCRIYLLEGRRRPVFGNPYIVTQEISVEIYAHEDFESDKRIAAIGDRVNELVINNMPTGFGRMTYAYGNPRQAPQFYRAYYHNYEVNMISRVNGGWKNRDRLR